MDNELIDELLLFFLLVGEVLDCRSKVVEKRHVAEVEGESVVGFMLLFQRNRWSILILLLISQT